MIYLVWGLFGLVFVFLFVCMLRNMFFTMLDKRAEEEYDRALDEGTRRPVVFNAVADRYEYQELPEKAPIWFEDHFDDRDVRLSRVTGGTNYGVRRPFLGASVSGPYPEIQHVAMYTEDGNLISAGQNFDRQLAVRRFNHVKDQI